MEKLSDLQRRTLLKLGGVAAMLPVLGSMGKDKALAAERAVAQPGRGFAWGLTSFNEGWYFHSVYSPDLISQFRSGEEVMLPHTAVELPYNYFSETVYHRPFGYQAVLEWHEEFADAEVFLVFDGAMADTVVYLNGREVAAHPDGYTPFEARLTGGLKSGANLVTVRLDGTENPDIPPFGEGGGIDYLAYAGIYRDVWLKVVPKVSIGLIKIETPDALGDRKTVSVRCDVLNPQKVAYTGQITASLKNGSGEVIKTVNGSVAGTGVTLMMEGLSGLSLWDVDDPVLYTMDVTLVSEHGAHTLSSVFGFRAAEFRPDGFFLNGRRIKLRGLNRHQSFPYVGYAMGRRAQERDADILKKTLKVNSVRTSHYPQSKWFLDRCDQLGLLVFEELPGWAFIGEDLWKKRSVENVRGMIRRDWNHPSIVLWGVRINESDDDHDFYTETNRVARELDPTRQTSGVRVFDGSELLEDVYAMNDFYLRQEEGAPVRSVNNPREITGLDRDVPYIISEFNGHMWPTKRFDQENHQVEHVKRYLEVLNSVYGMDTISGCFGWCMADYHTHNKFGSGDRICHHGVLDMFREPKFAAYVYSSQCDPADEVVLKPVTHWSQGDRTGGWIWPLIVLTNCDEVEFRMGSSVVRKKQDRETYPHLPHPPVVFTSPRGEGEDEFWRWQDSVFTGFINGKAVKTVRLPGSAAPTTLQVEPDTLVLSSAPKDSVRVMVRVLDQAGNPLVFFDDAVSIQVSGPAKVIGPSTVTLRGGRTGFWLETLGGAGEIRLTASTARLDDTVVILKTVK